VNNLFTSSHQKHSYDARHQQKEQRTCFLAKGRIEMSDNQFNIEENKEMVEELDEKDDLRPIE
jgi:hypothetical protein